MARTHRRESPNPWKQESKEMRKEWSKRYRKQLKTKIRTLRDYEEAEDLPELPNKTSGWMTH